MNIRDQILKNQKNGSTVGRGFGGLTKGETNQFPVIAVIDGRHYEEREAVLRSFDLEKGKRAVVGEIRTWSGIKYVKTPTDWVVYQDTKKIANGKMIADNILAQHWGIPKEEAASRVIAIMETVNGDAPDTEKMAQLRASGVSNPRTIATLSGASYEDVITTEQPNAEEEEQSIEDAIRLLLEADGLDFGDGDLDKINPLTGKDAVDTVQDKFTDMIAKKERKLAMFYGTGGVGKAQPLTSLILTSYGFKTMGEIKPGHRVITEDGSESIVLREYPQGEREVYIVKFSDGRKVECDRKHLWKVIDRNTGKYRILPIDELIRLGVKERRFGVPIFKGWQYKGRKKPLKIDPWLLGYLLGDGCMSQKDLGVSFSVGDRDKDFIVSKVQEILEGDCIIKYTSQYDYSINATSTKQRKGAWRSDFSKAINDYGLYGTKSDTKFIPEDYLRSSREDKLELVRGLMDSDGYVVDGNYIYTSVSKKMAQQFKEIVLSLGSRFCNLKEDDSNVKNGTGKLAYDVYFRFSSEIIPVTLPFKLDRVDRNNRIKTLSIVEIEETERKVEMKCILIDHPSHMYVTDNFILTHNTYGVKQVLLNPKTLNGDTGEPFNNQLVEYDSELAPTAEQYDLIKFTGKITPSKLFRALYEHNGKVIMFDDADSVLLDEDSVNLLKAATDTTLEDVVWDGGPIKASTGDERLPTRFKFTGGIVIISNLSERKLQAVASPLLESRALSLDVSRTMDETIDKLDRIKNFLPFEDRDGEPIEVGQAHRDAAINFIKAYKNHMPVTQVNGRTLGALALLHLRGGRKFKEDSSLFVKDFAAKSLMNVKKEQILNFHKNRLLKEKTEARRKAEIRSVLNSQLMR